jgi:hypothetical protein
MAYLPRRAKRQLRVVDPLGDYATLNFHPIRDGT